MSVQPSRPVPSKEDLADIKLGQEMEDLINTPGWKIYSAILQKHIDNKIRDAFLPVHQREGSLGQQIDGVTQVLLAEASKGAIIGLRLALEIPSGIVAGSQTLRKKYNPSAEENS